MTDPVSTTPPPPLPSMRPRRNVWSVIGVVVLALLATVVVAGNFVRVPYVIISPGDATPLDQDVVTISGTDTYEHAGNFLFLTVRVSNSDPTLWRWVFAQLDGNVEVTKRQDVIGCASYEQNASLQDLLMRESQDIAKTVALERLGYEVEAESKAVVIVDVICDGPSEGHLLPGDVITAIDGTPIVDADDIGPPLQAHDPGETAAVTVTREGEEVTERIRLGVIPEELRTTSTSGASSKSGGFLGIRSQLVTNERFPFDIEIDTARVSGPSAGLAFTLAIIDELTPGNLTGGRPVAVTGSIAPDGTVDPVGGVEQKAIAAQRHGARLMLVPACKPPHPRDCEVSLARPVAEGMRVVMVDDIDDALRALRRAGGDPVPPRPSTTTAT